ncbi:MAG: class I SAM-dependent methyltransferase [Gammaproteobacteria bacterium]|nr:class I SAM-dependent methyltransferase [Gammaproteobacteria bacterium]
MNLSNKPITVSYTSVSQKEAAENFAADKHLTCHPYKETNSTLTLNYSDNFVELRDVKKNIAIHIDFISGELAHRQQYGGGKGQSIAKAIGLKQGSEPPSVLDATAGLAKDAYVLACLGCPLTLLERSPIIVELIRDAIHRAKEDDHFQSILDTGFNLIEQSSIDYLTALLKQQETNPDVIYPDVIYLDPMYPERKKSASVKKNMQLLQTLLGQDEDTQTLLDIALKVAKKRVVVKRPKGTENLSELVPTYKVESKKTRYDIYIIQK